MELTILATKEVFENYIGVCYFFFTGRVSFFSELALVGTADRKSKTFELIEEPRRSGGTFLGESLRETRITSVSDKNFQLQGYRVQKLIQFLKRCLIQ